MASSLVSVVIPTLNGEPMADRCLQSVRDQTYPNIEVIVVDGYSTDGTVEIARQYADRVYEWGPDQRLGRVFGAPAQRNYGAEHAAGEFIYYVDIDMMLPPELIANCVSLCIDEGADAVVVPEQSFGSGFWAEIKALERGFYLGDDLVEAPRFVRSSVWRKLGGLNSSIGGTDDWDLGRRLRAGGYAVGRSTDVVLHDEGALELRRLARKRYLYGKNLHLFVREHGVAHSVRQFNPIRKGYVRGWRTLLARPTRFVGLVVMRFTEYAAGGCGILVGLVDARRGPSGVARSSGG